MKLHPLCKLFPEITGEDFKLLVDDIKANGLREPITTLEGMILDGQNRYNACIASGIKAQFDPYIGSDPVKFVISKNLSRRHLNESQRAMLAAELVGLNSGQTMRKAAQTLNVSRDSVQKATRVKRASRSLTDRVKAGTIKLNAAHEQVNPRKKSPLPNPVIPETKTASKDAPKRGKVTTISLADFQCGIDMLEAMIPADCDHKKYGVILNSAANRQMNFAVEKKEFNPYGR